MVSVSPLKSILVSLIDKSPPETPPTVRLLENNDAIKSLRN